MLLYILTLFILIIFVSSSVVAETFLDMNEITNSSSYLNVGGKVPDSLSLHKDWWMYNARKYNSINTIDFSKDFWMPIQPWEYEVCSRGLSTQLVYEGGAGVGSIFSGIYADTVTVAAYKRTPERNVDTDASMLYEVAWYFHPANNGKYYDIKLVNTKTNENKVIQEKTGASTKSGDSGYVAFYSVTNYDKVVLNDESTPKEYRFNIVNTTDADR
jgi:hypothetical protein